MKILLVYAGDPNANSPRAPYSITYNLYQYLSKRASVVYYNWDYIGSVETDADTIILGHPHYDQNTIIQRLFRENRPCRARCLIHPFHHHRVEDNFPFNDLVMMADRHFPICGPYWYDTIVDTPFSGWRSKMFRLDMALDTTHFHFRRQQFHPVGQRRLLYVGSSMPQKNLGLMTAIMKRLPSVQMDWYGGYLDHPLAKLPNVRTTGWSDLTSDLLDKMTAECDIFINTSISDASPTAMLEAAATGFVVACTNESGIYNSPMVTELSAENIDYDLHMIQSLLAASEEQLLAKAAAARAEIERTHTWDRFCDRLWTELCTL